MKASIFKKVDAWYPSPVVRITILSELLSFQSDKEEESDLFVIELYLSHPLPLLENAFIVGKLFGENGGLLFM